MGHLVLEIKTTRDISRQRLRHKSFSFQEFSQRYAESEDFTASREARLQDKKNRQNSLIIEEESKLHKMFKFLQDTVLSVSLMAYKEALSRGIAKEQARALLPEGLTETKMYMSGSIRSWIHYIQLRGGPETQKEHREIALKCKDILLEQLPILKDILDET